MVSPVTFSSPTGPSTYTWEATNEEIAARYGVAIEVIARFDLNTVPLPPAVVEGILAAGRFETPLSEYPPSDYRRLTEVAAARYGVALDEILVGAGADEILDLIAKAFLAPGRVAVIPSPTYAMYRVLSEQRGAAIVDVPRRPARDGWALDVEAVRAAAARASVIWLCDPNNPTGRQEPEGAIPALLAGIAADADADGRPRPIVAVDEAYAEFAGRTTLGLRSAHPELVVVRTISKAYGLAGLRVGFAVARPETITRIAPYRPPGSVSTVSVTVAAAVLADEDIARANVDRVERERPRLAAGLTAAGWSVGPSITNFLLVDLGSPGVAAAVAEELLRRGLVPRTFGAGHPLAGCLRLTVRGRNDNERLIQAAHEIADRTSPGGITR
jgi:histidinol-phosphate aminotransferase